MTAQHYARLFGRLVALAVLVFSGTYLLVYLYRWEWNRALVSGIFFVSAEVALASGLILSRLRAIEDHLAEGPGPRPVAPDQSTARRSPFSWLDPGEGGLGVFIPILLGAGVILSSLAYVVERVSRFTAAPVAEHDLARRLSAISFRVDSLLAEPGEAPVAVNAIEGSGHRAGSDPVRRAAAWVTVAVLVGAVAVGVDALRDATMTMPEEPETDSALEITLDVDTREAFGGSTSDLVLALYVACRVRLPDETRAVEIADSAEGVGRLVVAPAIGPTSQRRLIGCLEDATLDRVSAEVVSVERIPLPDT